VPHICFCSRCQDKKLRMASKYLEIYFHIYNLNDIAYLKAMILNLCLLVIFC